ncbi:hypothetical protein Asppvi_002005 [Aspergillus pseudoviridinutans]|uniref:Uncharacterized protein n=1 Tax=Aspergillus pseudoviridinutans TaxID=1517512 RepID=A0A9P3BKE4_9EURO|nr:uncharacterized protein Asppvi_002005 [Aspergillus pseudoviridinutans]GIJ92727.1 hypothetical protein Asppvi_002005 [Aspergillus pseudoviridinutans]
MDIRRHQRSDLTERSRPRQLSAKRQRRGQREAWLSSISINTPSPSEYDTKGQSPEMQVKARQKPTSSSHNDQPTAQPPIARARRLGARRMRLVKAPLERGSAGNPSEEERPTPDLSDQVAYHNSFLDVFGLPLNNPVVTDLPPPATPYNILQALWVLVDMRPHRGSVSRYATRGASRLLKGDF